MKTKRAIVHFRDSTGRTVDRQLIDRGSLPAIGAVVTVRDSYVVTGISGDGDRVVVIVKPIVNELQSPGAGRAAYAG